jgi:hypothetical protein
VIGGGPHEAIAAAARLVVSLSKSHLSSMPATSEYPLPSAGQVRFYVLTTKGVLTAEVPEGILGTGKYPLSLLFYAAHEVITGLREIGEAGRQ